jgi:hypothetical protein
MNKMEQRTAWYWAGGIAVFLFIGLLISLVNLNSYSYYQSQNYNNLPSLTETETAPIQHYEQQRDALTTQTESDPENESVAENSTNVNMFGYAGDGGKYLLPPLIYADGTLNLFAFAVFMSITFVLNFGLVGYRLLGIRVRGNLMVSSMIALGFVVGLGIMGMLK